MIRGSLEEHFGYSTRTEHSQKANLGITSEVASEDLVMRRFIMLHVKFDQPGTGDDFLSAMVNSIEASINMYFGVARPVMSILILPPGAA